MHTLKVETDTGKAVVNHNSDWSGEAIVHYTDRFGERQTVEIPGFVLLAIGNAAAHENISRKLIAAIEEMAPPKKEG